VGGGAEELRSGGVETENGSDDGVIDGRPRVGGGAEELRSGGVETENRSDDRVIDGRPGTEDGNISERRAGLNMPDWASMVSQKYWVRTRGWLRPRSAMTRSTCSP
jgi:hypothetical protein